MRCELFFEIVKRKETVCGIEILVILAVGTLDFAVVAWSIWSDELVPYTHIGGGFLEKSELMPMRGETVCELGAVVGLYTFNRETVFFEERRGVLQKSRRAEGAQLLEGFQITKTGKLIKGGILVIFLAACLTHQTCDRNVFHVDLHALAGILHLFIRLWNVFRVGRFDRHLPAAPQYAIYAGDASRISSLHEFHPKHDQSRVWIPAPHISDQLQFLRRVLVRVAVWPV